MNGEPSLTKVLERGAILNVLWGFFITHLQSNMPSIFISKLPFVVCLPLWRIKYSAIVWIKCYIKFE